MALITATEYEDLVNESLADLPDAYVTNLLDAVSNHVANYFGKPLAQQAFTETLNARVISYLGQEVLQIRVTYTPVVSVSAVGIWYVVDNSEPTALSIADAMVHSETGEILVLFGAFGTWQVFFTVGGIYRARVTYTAGPEGELPTEVKRAIALLVQEQLAADAQVSKANTDDVVSYKIEEYSETRQSYTDRVQWRGIGLGTRNSRIAAEILSAYMGDSGALLV